MPLYTHAGPLWHRVAQLVIAAMMTVAILGTGIPTPRSVIGDELSDART